MAQMEPNYSPQDDDEYLEVGRASVASAELLVTDSDPAQIRLVLKGSLPTPCHKLRITVETPDEKNQIQVRVYSVIEPDMSIQWQVPFQANVDLGSFAGGRYSVLVNGHKAGDCAV